MEEVDTWSPAEFQKHTKDAATQYPALIAFVVAMLMTLNPQSRNQSLLVVITLIRIFERHYGRGHNEILENDIKAVVERNARLMVNTVDGLDQNPGDVVQPFLLQFIADVAFDFEHDEMPKTEDGHTMLLVLKSTLDILDRAYAGTRVATELVLTTPA